MSLWWLVHSLALTSYSSESFSTRVFSFLSECASIFCAPFHSSVSSRNVWIRWFEYVCVKKLSAVQPSYVFRVVCVYLGGGVLMFSVVLSLLLQQETGTEVVRSQGTIGFQKEEEEVTIAQASSSLLLGVTGSVLLPWCVLSCQRPQWNKLNPDTSLSEVPAYTHTHTHWQEAGPVVFFYSTFLFCHFFLFPTLIAFSSTPLSVTTSLSKLCPCYTVGRTVLDQEICEQLTLTTEFLFCVWSENRPKQIQYVQSCVCGCSFYLTKPRDPCPVQYSSTVWPPYSSSFFFSFFITCFTVRSEWM